MGRRCRRRASNMKASPALPLLWIIFDLCLHHSDSWVFKVPGKTSVPPLCAPKSTSGTAMTYIGLSVSRCHSCGTGSLQNDVLNMKESFPHNLMSGECISSAVEGRRDIIRLPSVSGSCRKGTGIRWTHKSPPDVCFCLFNRLRYMLLNSRIS